MICLWWAMEHCQRPISQTALQLIAVPQQHIMVRYFNDPQANSQPAKVTRHYWSDHEPTSPGTTCVADLQSGPRVHLASASRSAAKVLGASIGTSFADNGALPENPVTSHDQEQCARGWPIRLAKPVFAEVLHLHPSGLDERRRCANNRSCTAPGGRAAVAVLASPTRARSCRA